MLGIIGQIAYLVIGLLILAKLLSDKQLNNSWKDLLFCIMMAPIWPFIVGFSAAWALYDNIQGKRFDKKMAKRERIIFFTLKLLKMNLISRETHLRVQRELNGTVY